MKKKLLLFLLAAIFTVGMWTVPVQAYPDITVDYTFIFCAENRRLIVPDSFKLHRIVPVLNEFGHMPDDLIDMHVTDDGRIFILDMQANRVLIYNDEFELERDLVYFNYNGEVTTLDRPEGIFIQESTGIIYIADTNNRRILQSDEYGNIIFVTYGPETFPGTDFHLFYPTNVVADVAGNQTVIARHVNMGFLQFSPEGEFVGYMGAPRVQMSGFTRIIRRFFSTREQRQRMWQFVPTEYSNVAIDRYGFIYGTISSLALWDVVDLVNAGERNDDVTPIKRFNAAGDDILKRNGLQMPIGNLDTTTGIVSRVIDVALGPGGTYTLLCSATATLYTYSDEGILLHAFGRQGRTRNTFGRPVAVDYMGNELLVLDAMLGVIKVFTPTEYNLLKLEALTAEYYGYFDIAYPLWGEVSRLNTAFRYAYIGLGMAAYESGEFRQAMTYFANARHDRNYSRAKERLRMENMETAFPIIFAVLVGAVAILFIKGTTTNVRTFFRERM